MQEEIKGLLEGDRLILRAIYKDHLDSVVNWVRRNKGSRQDALDVFQEGLTQLLLSAKRGKLDHVESFASYFIGTCKFIWLGRIKKEERLSQLKEWDNGEQLYQMSKFLEQSKEKLSDTCKQLLALLGKELKPKIIAEQLNMTNANTVYRRKFACFKKWRELIEADPIYHQWKREEYGG